LYISGLKLNSNILLGSILGTVMFISLFITIVFIIIKKFQRTNKISKTKVKPFLENNRKKSSLDRVNIRRHDNVHVVKDEKGIISVRGFRE